MTLICHAATVGTRRAAFPSDDPIEVDAARRAGSIRRVDQAWTSPAAAARQTAVALGLDATLEPALRELDYGAWATRTMDDIDPADLATWLADPNAAPHGGESIAALLDRTASWMDALPPTESRIVAITHASVIRAALLAALNAPPSAFWRIDVAPLSRARLSARGSAWTLRSIGPVTQRSRASE